MSARIWFGTWITFTLGAFIASFYLGTNESFFLAIGCAVGSFIGSLPALPGLWIVTWLIKWNNSSRSAQVAQLFIGELLICILYGTAGELINMVFDHAKFDLELFLAITGILFACNLVSTLVNIKRVSTYFGEKVSSRSLQLDSSSQTNTNMQDYPQAVMPHQEQKTSYKTTIKAAITGGLILLMLIPTAFIMSLVNEREDRQKQVVTEVSDKWGKEQTFTGPYIFVPYNDSYINSDNKIVTVRKHVILLPDNLQSTGNVVAEQRPRSIYKVLLYKTSITATGNFKITFPNDLAADKLLLQDARLCIGIDDFKGIEGPVTVSFNGTALDLTPGIPTKQIDSNGLSAPVNLTAEILQSSLPFTCQLNLRGSERLSFVPLSGNSSFTLKSAWPNPSFDGATLPSERSVTDKGFSATWKFNKANLPFGTFLKDFELNKSNFLFGVTMLQPADQYAKTMRSVKYAILFIGLTFSLFFIIELMQKKPVHPVQYVLVGLALVIFYTLLLSISEYIPFNQAYLISATATILLITLYAKGHFESWKTASVFGGVLSALYTFTFVLVTLEDTSLIVGSIGLFIVLALVMYASRKVNWYNPSFNNSQANPI